MNTDVVRARVKMQQRAWAACLIYGARAFVQSRDMAIEPAPRLARARAGQACQTCQFARFATKSLPAAPAPDTQQRRTDGRQPAGQPTAKRAEMELGVRLCSDARFGPRPRWYRGWTHILQ